MPRPGFGRALERRVRTQDIILQMLSATCRSLSRREAWTELSLLPVDWGEQRPPILARCPKE